MGAGASLSKFPSEPFPSAQVVKTWSQDDVLFQLGKRGLADEKVRQDIEDHAETFDGNTLLRCSVERLKEWGLDDDILIQSILAVLPKDVAIAESGRR